MALGNHLLIYQYNSNLLFMYTEPNNYQGNYSNNILDQTLIGSRLLDLEQPKLGNIYYCKIIKFQKSLNSFFIDLGNNFFALLKNNKQTIKILKNPTIGQKFLAIVIKEGTQTKYPLVSPKIILEGLLCDFKPFSNKIDFNPELNLDIKDKENIKKSIYNNFSNNIGLSIKKNLLPELLQEIKIKIQFWDQIFTSSYDKLGLIHSYKVLDLLYENFNNLPKNIITNSLSLSKLIKQEINTFIPFSKINILYNNTDIFLQYLLKLEEKISNVHTVNDEITLYIYNTRALTFIDIDFKGLYNLHKEDALIKANITAVNYIVGLIKLRNLSGQIFIDALKIKKDSNKDLLLNEYINTFKKFNIKVKIMGFTKLGVLEIERSKKYNSINDSLFKECNKCEGQGKIINHKLIYIKTIMQISKIIKKNPLAKVTIKGSQCLLEQFKIHNKELINCFIKDSLNFIIDNNIINTIIVY